MEAATYSPHKNGPIRTNLFKWNYFASCSVPPIRWHLKAAADGSNRTFLEGHEVHKREPAIRCQTFCPSCFKCAHLKSAEIYVLDPGHRSVMDEVATVVEVIDGCLYVNTSSAAFKLCFLEGNCLTLHIGCVQTKSNATAFKNKCLERAKHRLNSKSLQLCLWGTRELEFFLEGTVQGLCFHRTITDLHR